MASDLPETIDQLETPCFLVDIDIVKRNCQRMIDRCKKFGVDLRPHMKTQKTIEGAELMTGGTKRKIVVSTVREAEFFADHGFDDILFASPIVRERLSSRLKALANKLDKFHLIYESEQGINGLINTPLDAGKKWSVFLDVDCGYGRTGVIWNTDIAIQLAKIASDADNIEFQGIYVHCGNTYNPDRDGKVKTQTETTERLLELKNRLTAAGIECRTYGCGSTPSCTTPIEQMTELTEFHPGNYVFYDYMQVVVGSCSVEDIACKVAATIICHKPESNTIITDAGFAALSWDGFDGRFSLPLGPAPVEGHPELKLVGQTQELGKLQSNNGEKIDFDKFPLGSRLNLYPFHSCATAGMHRVYYIHSGGKIVGTWKPCSGW